MADITIEKYYYIHLIGSLYDSLYKQSNHYNDR